MKFLEIDLNESPLGPILSDLALSSRWDAATENSLEATVQLARQLVAEVGGTALEPELAAFLQKHNSPWGLAILKNMPVSPNVRREFLLLAELLGRTVRFDDEGDYLIEVKEDLQSAVKRPGFNNSKEFFPHTDLSYSDSPPTFFCLHSINNNREQGGFSEFVDIADVIEQLSDDHIATLRSDSFLFPAPVHYGGSRAVLKPILTKQVWGPDEVRFRRDNLRCVNRDGIDSVIALCKTIQGVMSETFLEPGSVAVIDNRRVLHGRTAFLGGPSAKSPRHINRLYFDFVQPGPIGTSRSIESP